MIRLKKLPLAKGGDHYYSPDSFNEALAQVEAMTSTAGLSAFSDTDPAPRVAAVWQQLGRAFKMINQNPLKNAAYIGAIREAYGFDPSEGARRLLLMNATSGFIVTSAWNDWMRVKSAARRPDDNDTYIRIQLDFRGDNLTPTPETPSGLYTGALDVRSKTQNNDLRSIYATFWQDAPLTSVKLYPALIFSLQLARRIAADLSRKSAAEWARGVAASDRLYVSADAFRAAFPGEAVELAPPTAIDVPPVLITPPVFELPGGGGGGGGGEDIPPPNCRLPGRFASQAEIDAWNRANPSCPPLPTFGELCPVPATPLRERAEIEAWNAAHPSCPPIPVPTQPGGDKPSTDSASSTLWIVGGLLAAGGLFWAWKSGAKKQKEG